MTVLGYGQIALYLAVLAILAWPLGVYIHWAMEGISTPASRVFKPLENTLYRACRIEVRATMGWSAYTVRLLVFNAVGALFLYAIQRCQVWLPLNQAHFGRVSPDSAFNTAVSFVSNTSWQSYAGETTLSYLTQMLGITVQSFLSAAASNRVTTAAESQSCISLKMQRNSHQSNNRRSAIVPN